MTEDPVLADTCPHDIASARLGDRQALERVLVFARQDLRRYAEHHCVVNDVEDAVQETLLTMARRLHALRLLVPPAWQSVDTIDPDLRAFYEFYSPHMEPWDGPAGIVTTDGRYAACTLDRNGLRPSRWVITRNRHLTIASEMGVWDFRPEDVVRKGKLGPGEMLVLDLQTGELMDTKRVDDVLKSRHPYKTWLKKGVRYLESDLIDSRLAAEPFDRETLESKLQIVGVA